MNSAGLLRRTATAAVLAAGLVLGSALPALAARGHHKAKPAPAADTPPADTAPPKPAPRHEIGPAPRIPLQRNLRFVLRPTLLGLVPPPDPLDLGEAFVRVLGVDSERLVARYEIKEQVAQDPASGEVYPLNQAPAGVSTKPLLRIRRGDVGAKRRGADPEIISPLFWTTGDWQTTCGLLWIDRDALAALKAGSLPAWHVQFPENVPGASDLKQVEAQRWQAAGVDAKSALGLKLLQTGAAYRCLVNGAAVDLPAVRAVDNMLLAEYWFLDDPDNPLLLKMSYLPLETVNPAETGWAGVIDSGGGFAVTEIDF